MESESHPGLHDEERAPPLGLYLHIPFCRTRCAFCAFYLEIHREDRLDRFRSALREELAWYGAQEGFRDRRVSTVYFGGGTPTILQADDLADLLDAIRWTFHIETEAEISVEGHPASITTPLLDRLRESGVTRLSLGVESMHQEELLRVGRAAAPHATFEAVACARAAGFHNINLDLMYGLPGQSIESWLATLDSVLALSPTHVSCYALTVEDDTPLAGQITSGATRAPDPGRQTELELAAEALLLAAGYRRYELSNYARPGYECRHNLLYWQAGSYLGLGPSAQSYVDGVRFGNVADLDHYARLLASGRAPVEFRESLTLEQRQREALVFGLRQTEGVDRTLVDALSQDARWRATLEELIRGDILELAGRKLRLSPKGRQLADSVGAQLI